MAVRAGLDRANMVVNSWQAKQLSPDTHVEGSADVGSTDATLHRVWRVTHSVDNTSNVNTRNLRYKFPASKDIHYQVSLGFNDIYGTASGNHVMDVYINDTLMTPGAPGDADGPVDVFAEVGSQAALVKTFSATPVVDE